MVRVITFLLSIITSVFKLLSRWSIGQIISITRFGTPWAIRMILFILGAVVQLSLIAVLSTFKGAPKVARAIADDWTSRAINGGFPGLWEIYLRGFFYPLALCTLMAGWVIVFFMALFTSNIALYLMFQR